MDRPTLSEIQMQANSIEETSFSYQRYRLHQDYCQDAAASTQCGSNLLSCMAIGHN